MRCVVVVLTRISQFDGLWDKEENEGRYLVVLRRGAKGIESVNLGTEI